MAQDWCETSGFHPELIPHSLLLALFAGFYAWARLGGQDAGIVAGCIGFIVGGIVGYFGGLAAIKTRLKYTRWCQQHGWKFHAKGKPLTDGVVKNSVDAKKSKMLWRSNRNNMIMTKRFGERGASLHHVYTGNKKDQALFLVADSGENCVDLVIYHHSLKHNHGLKLPHGMQAVEFESSEFNKQWIVKAMDPKGAYDRVSQGVMEYLLATKKVYAIEYIGGLLIVRGIEDGLHARTRILLFTEGLSKSVPDDLLPSYDFGCTANG